MHHHQRGEQAGPPATPQPYPTYQAPHHCHSPGTSMAQAPRDTGSRAVLTIPGCAGTGGQVGAQHHGRDQVLKGWDLNQRQPEEGDNKGTSGRTDREGNRAAPKAQAARGTGVGREADKNPKVTGGYPIIYMCPRDSTWNGCRGQRLCRIPHPACAGSTGIGWSEGAVCDVGARQ